MSFNLPPVPLQDIKDLPYTLQEWLRKIRDLVSSAIGAIPWAVVDKTGSDLTDLVTRNHNDLQNKQGGTTSEYYHLTSAEYTAFPTHVVGPASAVDGNVVLFNTTTGKLVKDGGTLGTSAFTATYVLPTATTSVLGGVKPDGTSILNTAGAISVTPTSVGSPSGSGTSTGTNTGDNGTVTSVAVSGANGIGVSGSPITGAGTIALSLGAITPTSIDTSTGSISGGAGTFTGLSVGTGSAGLISAAGSNTDLTIRAVGAGGYLRLRINTFDYFTLSNDGSTFIGGHTSYVNGSGNTNGLAIQGNVGVGTVAPTTGNKLTVVGKTDISDAVSIGATSAGFSSMLDVINTTKNIALFRSSASDVAALYNNANIGIFQTTSTNNNFGFINFYNANSTDTCTIGTKFRGHTASALGDLFFATSNSGLPTIKATLTGEGNLGIGSLGVTTIGNSNLLQVAGTTAATSSLGISAWSADALGSRIELGKSRGATIGTNTIVQANDVVASVTGYGANGSTFTNLASISMEVDGTPGATNDMPGRIVFNTTPNGSGTLTEAMRLSQDQTALFASSITTAAPTTGTAAPWKLGTLVTGQVGLVMLTTQYLEVDVNGALVKLATI